MLKRAFAELVFVAMPKAAAGVLMLFLNLALARMLAPGEFGIFALCLSTILLLDAVIGGAVDLAVLRLAPLKQAEAPVQARAIELAALLLKGAIVLALLPLLAIAAPWIAQTWLRGAADVHLVWITAAATVALLMMRSTLAHLQVLGDFRGYGTVDWVNVVARFGIAGALLLAGMQHAEPFLLAILMGPVCAGVFNLRRIAAAWATGVPHLRAQAGPILRASLWFMPTLAIGALMSRLEIYVLGVRSDLHQVEIYAAAAAVAAIPELLGMYMAVVLAPRVMPAIKSARLGPLMLKVQTGLLGLSAAIMMVGYVALPSLMQAFLPPHLAEATQLVLVLLLGGLTLLVCLPFLMPFLLFQRPHFMLILDAVALPLTLWALVVAIDSHGALGAAWVSVASRLIRTLASHGYAWYLIRREVDVGDPPGSQPVAAAPGRTGLIKRYSRWNQIWNIDCHLRYRTAHKLMRGVSTQRVVEVGAGLSGLAYYIKAPVVGVDLTFNAGALRQSNPYLLPVIGTALSLPLGNDALEGALSIDSIEHIPAELRATAIREMLRVASRRVVISIPCGADAVDADRRLIAWHRARYGQRDFWLSEHLERGLPTEAFMRQAIEEAASSLGKSAKLSTHDDMPVLVHDVNHRILMLAHYRFARLLSVALWGLYPALKLLARRRHYRRFFVVDLLQQAVSPRPGDGLSNPLMALTPAS